MKGKIFLIANLKNLKLFRGLTAEEIEKFIHSTETKIKSYKRGERILEAFAKNSNIGVLVSGEAQVLAMDWLGNESVGHSLDPGAMFGTTSAILSEDEIGTSIQLTKDAQVLWIPYRALLVAGPKLGRIHGIVMKNFLEAFSVKNVLMMQKIELLSQRTLRERIILYLIQQERRQQSEKISVPKRGQFAKELECNRSALTREISQMQAENLLEVGKDFLKLNKENLQ